MERNERLRRYVIFGLGLVITALGVALAAKGELGNFPLASVPNSLSLALPVLTIGGWTIAFNLLLVLLQVLLLGKRALRPDLLAQMLVSVLFGLLIDLGLLCLDGLTPGSYPVRLLLLLLGCLAVGFGVYLEVAANVVMLPGDALNRALTRVTGKSFGAVRTAADVVMMALAAVISLVSLHRLAGVREGTLIAALAVGNLVRLFGKLLQKAEHRLLPGNREPAR